MSKDDNVLT